MKKTAIILAIGAALGGMTAANAAVLQAGSTGTITVNTGCFTFGTCVVNGDADDITDNAITVTSGPTGVTPNRTVGSGHRILQYESKDYF